MSDLLERFTYGNLFFITPTEKIYREITINAPQRQQEMISLAQQQIKAQKATADEIIRSNATNANMIATEIVQQTQTMERARQHTGNVMVDRMDHMSATIYFLGDRLCGVLYEIQWQLAQQTDILKDILYALRQKRKVEAQELIEQGLSHYENGEYEEAEERFRLAYKFDTTDYQVLMNLAYIEIHKDNANNAFTFFKKALQLPRNLDASAKSKTLWAMARLRYAEKNYDEAFAFAEQALQYDGEQNTKGIYTVGVYAALAGKAGIAIQHLAQAIVLNPTLFATTAVDPDLKVIRTHVLKLLSRLSEDMLRKTTTLFQEVRQLLAQVKKSEDAYYANVVTTMQQAFQQAQQVLQNPSFSTCAACFRNLSILQLYSRRFQH